MPNNELSKHTQSAPDEDGAPQERPAAPPPPQYCRTSNIFDCLVSGSLLFFFCLMSWSHGESAFGQYAFFRGGSVSGATLSAFTMLSGATLAFGLALLGLRIRHQRYCAVHFPKPKKKKGPNVWADMREALDQMLGLKPFEGMDKEAERAAPPKKRRLRDWLGQEKTRIGLSTFILFLLMYLTPGFILHLMGTHVLIFFLLEFTAIMITLLMWLIAWVELGE